MNAPPASATSHSKFSSDCAARCTATRDVEQNVCTVTLGPRSPSLYDTSDASESRSVPIASVSAPPASNMVCMAMFIR
jgi:recombination DNA repair RAD52 pathway protein